MDILTTLTIPNKDAIAKDSIRLSFPQTVTGAYTPVDSANWWEQFINVAHAPGTHALSSWLSACLDRTANVCEIFDYDITAHLDGSPHGSPIGSASFTLGAPQTTFGCPNQVGVLLAHTSDSEAIPVAGILGSVPVPESAQDYGAPATAIRQLKQRARYQNRTYFGPLTQNAAVNDANDNQVAAAAFVTDALGVLNQFLGAPGFDNRTVGVWSRRDAVLRPWLGGWVSHELVTRRKRQFVPGTRVTYGMA